MDPNNPPYGPEGAAPHDPNWQEGGHNPPPSNEATVMYGEGADYPPTYARDEQTPVGDGAHYQEGQYQQESQYPYDQSGYAVSEQPYAADYAPYGSTSDGSPSNVARYVAFGLAGLLILGGAFWVFKPALGSATGSSDQIVQAQKDKAKAAAEAASQAAEVIKQADAAKKAAEAAKDTSPAAPGSPSEPPKPADQAPPADPAAQAPAQDQALPGDPGKQGPEPQPNQPAPPPAPEAPAAPAPAAPAPAAPAPAPAVPAAPAPAAPAAARLPSAKRQPVEGPDTGYYGNGCHHIPKALPSGIWYGTGTVSGDTMTFDLWCYHTNGQMTNENNMKRSLNAGGYGDPGTSKIGIEVANGTIIDLWIER